MLSIHFSMVISALELVSWESFIVSLMEIDLRLTTHQPSTSTTELHWILIAKVKTNKTNHTRVVFHKVVLLDTNTHERYVFLERLHLDLRHSVVTWQHRQTRLFSRTVPVCVRLETAIHQRLRVVREYNFQIACEKKQKKQDHFKS